MQGPHVSLKFNPKEKMVILDYYKFQIFSLLYEILKKRKSTVLVSD